jgi:hypothetical protein
LLSFGCADPYIGKKASSWNHYLKRNVMTHEVVEQKHLIFDYTYQVDTENETISFDGFVKCNEQNITDWDRAEIEVYFLFMDSDLVIVDYKRLDIGDLMHNETLCEPKRFENIYPYKEDFYGVRLGYKISMEQ